MYIKCYCCNMFSLNTARTKCSYIAIQFYLMVKEAVDCSTIFFYVFTLSILQDPFFLE